MNTTLKLPFYAKFALISIGAIALFYTLHIGQQIILPVIYATIIAILVNPFVNYLVQKKINKIVAISIAVGTVILITAGLIYLISVQLSQFSESYPVLKERFNETSKEVIHWISVNFNIKTYKINLWINDTQSDAIKNMGGTIGQTISIISSVLIIVLLLPVYLCMILFYKDLLLEFIRKLFNSAHHVAVFEVLMNSKIIIQSYLIGLSFEILIMAVLNSAALLMLGIDYAILLGIIAAILNIIPYIGGIIATALPMLIAFITKDTLSYPLFVFLALIFIQFIDNNFIVPKIVASRVKINALISVIVVLMGGALWGVPGMFLSIPLTAIIKVIFDHIEPLKPWGYLLGNIVPTASKLKFNFITKKKKV